MTDNTNPGNFANRPHEEVVEIAKKGGQASGGGGGGSAATPKEKVVCVPLRLRLLLPFFSSCLPKTSFSQEPLSTLYAFSSDPSSTPSLNQETASKGGKAPKGGSSDGDSEDSTDTGSDNATEAGRTATGQFEKGGEAAKEAGRKGGLSS
ncbi:hypothetical protein MMC06_004832 [Schaereria dolodes]|nr:hypothetical protein [Schaereria dolodes]